MTEISNIDTIIHHWVETSDDDFETVFKLFEAQSYHWALFIGHISLEKLLKALFVSVHKSHAPHMHNLYRLAEQCDVDISETYADWLDTITTFNINARYDDYRKEFYKLCTREYTESWIKKIKELRTWIKEKL